MERPLIRKTGKFQVLQAVWEVSLWLTGLCKTFWNDILFSFILNYDFYLRDVPNFSKMMIGNMGVKPEKAKYSERFLDNSFKFSEKKYPSASQNVSAHKTCFTLAYL